MFLKVILIGDGLAEIEVGEVCVCYFVLELGAEAFNGLKICSDSVEPVADAVADAFKALGLVLPLRRYYLFKRYKLKELLYF